ncbi:hypothetical protein BAU14_07090 [Enterococcus sp. CU9D]|nr:hypothetical protein BAU14_07090 [Enterococcus sp. CU9D]
MRFWATLDPPHIKRLEAILRSSKKTRTMLLHEWIDQEYTLRTQWDKKIQKNEKQLTFLQEMEEHS